MMLAVAILTLTPLSQDVVGRDYALHPELELGPAGDVDEFLFTPDGSRIVYAAGGGPPFGLTHYFLSASVDGSGPVLKFTLGTPTRRLAMTPDGSRILCEEIQGGGDRQLFGYRTDRSDSGVFFAADIADFALAPDGGTVVFLHDGTHQLIASPVDHSSWTTLSSSGLSSVADFAIGPDGARVFYRSEDPPGSALRLHAVPLDRSSPPVQISATPAGNVTEFEVSPDGANALYLADQTTLGTFELFLSGPPALPVSAPLVPGGDVTAFAFAPDAATAVYLADQAQDQTFELYTVPLVGGPGVPAKVSGALVSGGDVLDFRVTPDSQQVLLRGDLRVDGVEELFVAPLDGSASPRPLNGTLVAGGDVRAGYALDDTGTRALYLADAYVDEHDALFSVPLDGSLASVRLNDPLVIGGDVAPDFLCHAGTVLYRAEQEIDGVAELHAVPVDGGTTTRLSATLAEGRTVTGFTLVAGGARVAYRADQDEDESFEVFVAPLDGSALPRRAHPRVQALAYGVQGVQPLADGRRALYLADRDLFVVENDGSAPPLRLNDPLAPAANLSSLVAVSPDVREVVYLQNTLGDGRYRLFSVPLDRSVAPRQLAAWRIPVGGSWRGPQITPDSTRVVFPVHGATGADFDLYVVPLDASAFPRRLDGAETFDDFRLTPDGARVFYRSNSGSWSVPTDGSAPPTPLTGVQARLDYAITPDSARLVYANPGLAPRLFSVPLAGGTVTQLGVWLQDIHFELVPDGHRALVGSVGKLYSVPVDGSQPFVQLATGVSSLLDVESTPDSTHVVFDSAGLNVMPVDGSSPPRLLTSESFWKFALTPDGAHALFLNTAGVLKSVPVHGTPTVTVITRPPIDCDGFVVDARSRRVLVKSLVAAEGRHELYVADLAARRDPERLSSQLTFGGVAQMWFAGDGRALYTSTDDGHLAGNELFGVLLPRAVRRR